MKKRYIQRQYNFDENDIKIVAEKFGIDDNALFLLKKYNVTSQNAEKFFSDGEDGLLDPKLMSGMSAAAEKIKAAVESGKKILIFGDYDADGISASAILKLYFDSVGADSFVYLPKRSEGYGLKIETMMKLKNNPGFDLVVTVDCGITAVDEVEFVRKILKTDIIVTDHHEPGDKLPACVCVNPKLGYPFRDLSGSGVALKVVQALSDEETAKHFCDLASIGTIADIMPLESENRAIVKLGCAHVRNKGLASLLRANKIAAESVDCSSMAMKICPKINAAGRVDAPTAALDLLLADNAADAEMKVAALMDANARRQTLTEKCFAEALDYIDKNNLSLRPAIFVYGEKWQHGILGLVANRLIEKFKVPVGAFMPDGDNIVGSLRTPEGIDLYAVVSELKGRLLRFGGHKMSVGVTLFKDCFEAFYSDFCEKISEHIRDSAEYFYDAVYDEAYLGDRFTAQLKAFEPVQSNNKVIFYGEFGVKAVNVFGKNKNYIKVLTQNGLQLKTFGDYTEFLPALRQNCNIECLFGLEYDDFEKKYVGMIIDMNIIDSISFDDIYLRNYISRISFDGNNDEREIIDVGHVGYYAQEGGCCCVFGSMLEFEKMSRLVDFSDFYLNFFFPRQFSNTVLIAPSKNVDLSKYMSVIIFCHYNFDVEDYSFCENPLFCGDKAEVPAYLYGQKIDRNCCVRIFKAIVGNRAGCIDMNELYLRCGVFEYSIGTFEFVVKIFEELGIFKVYEEPFSVVYNKDVRTELAKSKLFNMIASD